MYSRSAASLFKENCPLRHGSVHTATQPRSAPTESADNDRLHSSSFTPLSCTFFFLQPQCHRPGGEEKGADAWMRLKVQLRNCSHPRESVLVSREKKEGTERERWWADQSVTLPIVTLISAPFSEWEPAEQEKDRLSFLFCSGVNGAVYKRNQTITFHLFIRYDCYWGGWWCGREREGVGDGWKEKKPSPRLLLMMNDH